MPTTKERLADIEQQIAELRDTIESASIVFEQTDNTNDTNNGQHNDSGDGGQTDMLPINESEWEPVLQEDFNNGLDDSVWSTGFGWGENSSYTNGTTRPENVIVRNGQLELKLTDNPRDSQGNEQIWMGVVNTKDKLTYGPGTYLQAEMKPVGSDGTNTAFWGKPNTEAWPPEIDFVEIPDRDGTPDNSIHTAHWSDTVDDNDTHKERGRSWSDDPNENLADTFHTYGCEWMENRITWYVDGEEVWTLDDPKAMENINAGAPFYLMLSCVSEYTNWLPSPSKDNWPEAAIIRSVDIYETKSAGGGGDGNGNTGGNGGSDGSDGSQDGSDGSSGDGSSGGSGGGDQDGSGGQTSQPDHTHDDIQQRLDELEAWIDSVEATQNSLEQELADVRETMLTARIVHQSDNSEK